MDASKPSKTADLVAAARAIHMIRYKPRVFEDPFANQLCGDQWRRIIRSKFRTWLVLDVILRDIAPLAPLIPARARFGEDIINELVADGVDQYVIIGAGHDSFAMRRLDLRDRLKVFELDQPGTQREKLRRMAEFNIPQPDNVRYIDNDLNEVGLFSALENHGFDSTRRTAFSWWGVTYFLPFDTIRSTLQSIAENASLGSELFFDFRLPLTEVPHEWQRTHRKISTYVAKRGEPYLSELTAEKVSQLVLDCGFSEVTIPDTEEIYQRYFTQLPRKAMLTPTFRLCQARC